MISFTSNVKNEISSYDSNTNEEYIELMAIIRTIGKISNNEIEITSENSKVARRIYTLLKKIYNVNCEIEDKANSFKRSRLYIVKIDKKVNEILKDLGIIDENDNRIETINSNIIDSDEDKRAYLRGIFLSSGSINDPKTSRYHLEFFLNTEYEAIYLQELLNEYYLNSKKILKDNKYMVYVKEAERIGDFLRIISASSAVMYYEDIRIYRDHKNMTNRLNNMEQANIEKIINKCNEQLEDIKLIEQELGLDFLDEKTKEACLYRKKYPESSLQELSEIISLENEKNITKSGLNHRFRKIKEIATKIRNKAN